MATQIKELFEKPIDRYVNPVVVVSELTQEQIEQEIDEYIFTPELTKGLFKFLNALVNKEQGKTGIWISGYYGSGKSHFIKFIYYCLNPDYREKAFERFSDSLKNIELLEEDITPANVQQIKKKLDNDTTETVLFNIDAISKNSKHKDTITEVFLNKLNEHRGYNSQNVALALYLEKYLDKKDLFDQFKNKIEEEFEMPWEGNQGNLAFTHLKKVLEIASSLDSSIDINSLHNVINSRKQDYNIETLIKEFNDFLKDKDENYRLLFLVDEVSQYIGDNQNLLLNLETIIEEIGAKCGNQIWLACTAQQELPEVISNTGNDTGAFGKIMGRFETRISLESLDASDITKKRLLEKDSKGEGILDEFYNKYQVDIENQFVTESNIYKNFENKEDFVLTYPFVPYQFQLISDVFQSFSSLDYVDEEVKNTERSIIGITHYTAMQCMNEEVGYFVPFDLYLNNSFRERLKNRALNILKRALDLVDGDPFAQRVVKILFMISNLVDSIAVNFPATAENVALLLINNVDDSKPDIQQKVEEILDKLVDQNIIQYKNGVYKFFKEDEIDIANRISAQKINLDDIWSIFYENVIKQVLNPQQKVNFGNNVFRTAITIDDKEILQKGEFDIKFLLTAGTDLQQLAHQEPAQTLGIGLAQWYNQDPNFKSKVQNFVRTQKFLSLQMQGTNGKEKDTLKSFDETNKELLEEIKSIFKKKFLETPIFSSQQLYTADQFNSQSAKERLNEMINKHLEQLFHKHFLVKDYAASNQELKKHAQDTQLTTTKELTPAEDEVENKIKLLGESCTVNDIVNNFQKPPYGWKDLATLDVLIYLAKKDKRQFEWNNEELEIKDFADKALNTRERSSITILPKSVIDPQKIKSFVRAVNDEIFLEPIVKSTQEPKNLTISFKDKLKNKYYPEAKDLKETYKDFPFYTFLEQYENHLSELLTIRDTEKVMDYLIEHKQELKELRDLFNLIDEFTDNQVNQYKKIRDYCNDNENNFAYLVEEEKEKAEDLNAFAFQVEKPWENFPKYIKAHKEIKKALDEKVKSKQKEVKEKLNGIFDKLEERQKDLNLDSSILPSREYHIKEIDSISDIAQLELRLHKADEFKNEYMQKMEKRKAEENKEYTPSIPVYLSEEVQPRRIENEEQLDEYLNDLRENLLNKLRKNKKLYLS